MLLLGRQLRGCQRTADGVNANGLAALPHAVCEREAGRQAQHAPLALQTGNRKSAAHDGGSNYQFLLHSLLIISYINI